MKISENLKLTNVEKKTSAGRMGQLYFLTDNDSEQLVVKFQQQPEKKDRPANAVIETAILKKVGASAPNIRKATKEEKAYILKAVETAAAISEEIKQNFEADSKRYSFMVLMEFVEGESIAELQKNREGAEKFLEFIQEEHFQAELGKILGADLFAGNWDRMFGFAAYNGGNPDPTDVKAFVNTGNIIVQEKEGSPAKPIAIDNQFGFDQVTMQQAHRSWQFQKAGLWGIRSLGASIPSLALAGGALAREETGLLFEYFLDGAKKAKVEQEKIDGIRHAAKEEFQKNVALAANQALTTLLGDRGGKWLRGYKFAKKGTEARNAFKQHKRLLRQLMARETQQVTPEMLETAIDNARYKRWALTRQDELAGNDYVKEEVLNDKGEDKLGDDDYPENPKEKGVRLSEERKWKELRNKGQLEVRLKFLGQPSTNLRQASNLPDSSGSNQTFAQPRSWVPVNKGHQGPLPKPFLKPGRN